MPSVNEEPIKAGSGRVKTAMSGRHRVQPYSKGEARTRAKMEDKGLDKVGKGDFYRDPRYIGEKGSQDEAKAQFWRIMKWVVPIAIGILICMLTLLVRPVAKLEVEAERPYSKGKARTRAKMGDKGLDRVGKGDFYRDPRYIGEKGSQDEAKAQFWRMMKWAVPIAIGILICMLTLLVRPVAKLEVEAERLIEKARRHSETIRALEMTVGRMQVENEQLRRDIEHLREDKPRSGKENGRVPRLAQFREKGRSFRKGQKKQVSKR